MDVAVRQAHRNEQKRWDGYDLPRLLAQVRQVLIDLTARRGSERRVDAGLRAPGDSVCRGLA